MGARNYFIWWRPSELTRTMKAKPTKCKSLAMKKVSVTQQNGKISASHTPYDPHLCIGG